MSTLTHHLAITVAVKRMDRAFEEEQRLRAAYQVPSDNDAIETAAIARRSAYRDLKEAVDALINGGL